MNFIVKNEGRISIAVSRRNLLYLLKCLDLNVAEPMLHRMTGKGWLTIKAEEDEEHYNSEHRDEPVRGIKGIGPEDLGNGGNPGA